LAGGGEAQDLAVEGQFCLQAGDDRLGLAESVAFPLEGQQRVPDAVCGQVSRHALGLRGRHDRVVEALQQEHRAGGVGHVPGR
jgi:hypothetical protein